MEVQHRRAERRARDHVRDRPSAEEVAAAVSRRIEQGTALTLTGEKGRQLLVPAGVLGYVQLGETEKRGVGFGTLRRPRSAGSLTAP